MAVMDGAVIRQRRRFLLLLLYMWLLDTDHLHCKCSAFAWGRMPVFRLPCVSVRWPLQHAWRGSWRFWQSPGRHFHDASRARAARKIPAAWCRSPRHLHRSLYCRCNAIAWDRSARVLVICRRCIMRESASCRCIDRGCVVLALLPTLWGYPSMPGSPTRALEYSPMYIFTWDWLLQCKQVHTF